MQLTPPKKWAWYVSLFMGLLSILLKFVYVAGLSERAFWFLGIAWLLLLFATLLKGL